MIPIFILIAATVLWALFAWKFVVCRIWPNARPLTDFLHRQNYPEIAKEVEDYLRGHNTDDSV